MEREQLAVFQTRARFFLSALPTYEVRNPADIQQKQAEMITERPSCVIRGYISCV